MATDAAGLVVYVAALDRDPEPAFAPLVAALQQEDALAGYHHFVHPIGIRRTSGGTLAGRARDLRITIGDVWESCGRPGHVVLVGHSIGGLLVRRAFLDARGSAALPRESWFDHVDRVVLFAAPNRGINLRNVPWFGWLLSILASFPPLAGRFASSGALTGTPFITDLRIGWITLINTLPRPPIVVQLLGTSDPVVSVDDSRDLESMPTSAFLELRGANHGQVIDPHPPGEIVPGEQYGKIVRAVCGDVSEDVVTGDRIDVSCADVVFLLHGIRADAHGWVETMRRQLASPTIAIEHDSYGYLPAFSFTLPFGHNRNQRMFGDWYAEKRAKFPKAICHFVGHSNGTYIFAKALQRVPMMTFDRVYLAGSVLRPDYRWDLHVERHQLDMLVNACGSGDVPVGILCSSLHGVGRRELGVGGFRGFDSSPEPGAQFVSLSGGHDAGLTQARLTAVADYIRTGVVPDVTEDTPAPWRRVSARPAFRVFSRACNVLAPLVVIGGVAMLVTFFTWTLLLSVLGVLFVAAMFLTFF